METTCSTFTTSYTFTCIHVQYNLFFHLNLPLVTVTSSNVGDETTVNSMYSNPITLVIVDVMVHHVLLVVIVTCTSSHILISIVDIRFFFAITLLANFIIVIRYVGNI